MNSKVSEADRAEMLSLCLSGELSLRQIAMIFGVNASTVWRNLTYKNLESCQQSKEQNTPTTT